MGFSRLDNGQLMKSGPPGRRLAGDPARTGGGAYLPPLRAAGSTQPWRTASIESSVRAASP